MRVVVFGDVHGNQFQMYETAKELDADVVLQIGDFETVRDEQDLQFLPSPPKYRVVGDFSHFYSVCSVPIPTYFIGGNHEAFNVLFDVRCGGEIIQNLYFMGRSNVIQIGSLRVGGLSGIYVPHFFNERLKGIKPFENKKQFLRESKYFNREDVENLASQDFDILLLHDWPLNKGGKFDLVNLPDFDPVNLSPLDDLIDRTDPSMVFCGHMHRYHEYAQNNSKIICLNKFPHKNSYYVLDGV